MKGLLYLRRVLLMLCLIISMILTTQAQQTTVNCQVIQQNFGTGSCSATAKSTTSDIKAYSGGGLKGWAKFDVSNLPDNVTINWVKIHYNIGNHNYPYYVITKLNADPITTTAPDLFPLITGTDDSVNNDHTYALYNGPDVDGWQVKPLNVYARNDLQNSLFQDWFSVGFFEYEGGGTNYFLWAFGWDNGARPYLEVNYSSNNFINDLALTGMSSPWSGVCPGNQPVKVILRNVGSNMIQSALIHWSVNGGNQQLYTYNNTPGLASGATDTVTVGNFNFTDNTSTINATVSLPNGITDPNPSNNNFSKTITLNPASTFILQPLNQTVNVGTCTVFSVWMSYWANQTYQWQVSLDNGLSFTDLVNNTTYQNVDSSQLNVNNIALSMNGYLFRCRVTAPCGMIISNQALLTVNNSALAINQIYANPDTICSNSTNGTQLHTIVTGGTGVYIYNWSSVPAGFTSTLSSPLVYPIQNTQYFCTVSDGVNTVSGSCQVFVNNIPDPAGIIAGPSAVCKGQTSIQYTVPPIPGALYYYWTVPQGFIYSGSGNTISVNVGSTAVSGHISVKGYNYCGQGVASIKQITVNPSPLVNAGPDQSVYAGATVLLTATAGGGTAPYSFAWNNGMTGASITVTPTATTTYVVTVTDNSGCTATDYVVVTVNTSTLITTSFSNVNQCSGNVAIPVHVTNFYGVASISLSISYDTTKLQYTGYQSVHTNLSSGILLANASSGNIQVAWFSITPASIGTGNLFSLTFLADTGTSALHWNTSVQGACQYTNLNNITIPAVFYNSSIVVQSCSNVQGFAWYNNNSHTPMSNTLVVLKNNGVTAYQTMTDTSGNYAFTNLANGTYESSVLPTKPWGGVNAADALLILKHFVNMVTLTGVTFRAGDVDLSSALNSVDALFVAKRFVNIINSFPSEDWTSVGTTFTINGTANVYDSIQVLCSGDVDRSYYPPYAKLSPSVNLTPENNTIITSGQLIEIPVRVEKDIEIGSVSMVMDFSSDYLTLTDIKAMKDGYQMFTYDGKQIRYAWFSLEPMSLMAGEELLHIVCKVNSNDGELNINAAKDFEISDPNGISLTDVGLTYSKPIINNNISSLGQNIPNPFSSYTDIPYYLSESGNVQIAVYDFTGKLIKQLIDKQQDSGNYNLNLDGTGMRPGIYFVRMTLSSDASVSNFVQRMIIR